jgi:hypothetical protein
MTDIQKTVEQLDFLIKTSETYCRHDNWSGDSGPQDAIVLCNRLESAIERIALQSSSYRKQLERVDRLSQPYKLLEVRHVAIGLRDDMIAGWHASMVELVHADTYSDYLEMAEELLSKGYKDAAAVITGASLEVHVRALCAKHGVDTDLPTGAPKKADVMNADLKKAGVYEALQQKHITAWMDLRNQAAHGHYEKYDAQQVRAFISGVRDFMLKLPA